ncbi:MAG TPA: hypothetical protein VFM02_01715 [Candidatus Paceibacterota bacterium]|nr:hypothetical protein [Candidatus Paceibacterota bacterium]
MKKILYGALALLAVTPGFAFAQTSGGSGGLAGILGIIGNLINIIIPILITLAVLFFFYGLAMFILKSGDAGARSEGISIMIWGIIALFVIVSVWGLVKILQDTFGVNNGGATTVTAPTNVQQLTPTIPGA